MDVTGAAWSERMAPHGPEFTADLPWCHGSINYSRARVFNMLTREQQGVYRPLVSKAWIEHCKNTGPSPNNKPAYDAWYRDQLHSSIGVWSTKDADPVRDFQLLIDRFKLLAGDPQPVPIQGWSESQTAWFEREAVKAHNAELSRGSTEEDFRSWVNKVLVECDIHDHTATDRKKSFDQVMAYIGTISGDDALISHFSEASEIRMRWQIRRFMGDLAYLEQRSVEWAYVRAIWTQADLLPNLDEAPAATLVKVLQMLDSHIRRLCHRAGIRPRDLPSRSWTCAPLCEIPVSPMHGRCNRSAGPR